MIEIAEGFADRKTEPYPDNVLAAKIFGKMMTQWRAGVAGAIGLAYEALPVVLRICKVKEEEEEELFDCLQIMERAALIAMRGNG